VKDLQSGEQRRVGFADLTGVLAPARGGEGS
jgi:hypothetical protein